MTDQPPHGHLSELRIPAHDASLQLARRELTAALALIGWNGTATERAILAADEAIANAIEHGSFPGCPVHVDLHACERWATVVVRDEGRPDSPTPRIIPETPPPPTQTRGRGLIIMARLADEIVLRPAGGGTEVHLRFAHPASLRRRHAA